MAHAQQLFDKFSSHADTCRMKGLNYLGKPDDYIPYSDLREYWDAERVGEILASEPEPIQVPTDTIIDSYLRIFSTLVYCSEHTSPMVHFIKNFINKPIDDHNLPLNRTDTVTSNIFPRSESGRKAADIFYRHQFLFFPRSLCTNGAFPQHAEPKVHHNRRLEPEEILPVDFGEVLSENNGSGSIVRKCRLHPASNLHVPGVRLHIFWYQ